MLMCTFGREDLYVNTQRPTTPSYSGLWPFYIIGKFVIMCSDIFCYWGCVFEVLCSDRNSFHWFSLQYILWTERSHDIASKSYDHTSSSAILSSALFNWDFNCVTQYNESMTYVITTVTSVTVCRSIPSTPASQEYELRTFIQPSLSCGYTHHMNITCR